MQSAPKGQRRTFFGFSLLKAQNKILSPFEQVQSNILHRKRVMEMPKFAERNIQFAVWFLCLFGVFFWLTWKNTLIHKLGDENTFDEHVVT